MVVATLNPIKIHTAEDLFAMPSDARYELVRGGLVEMSPPGGEHGYVTGLLGGFATVFILEKQLGFAFAAETGFIVSRDPDTVLAPDFAFITGSRMAGPVPKTYLTVVPDLVLETRSPSVSAREVALKVERWILAGVQVVWDLDPDSRILAIHRPGQAPRFLRSDDTLKEEGLLPGFAFPLARIFAHRSGSQ